jgi:DNA-directed RNA polymerase II subunit RPB1
MSEKRLLTQEEIDDLLSVIRPTYRFPNIEYADVDHVQETIRKQLETISIYPEKIPTLKQLIEINYLKAQVAPGESVGVAAGSFLGEQNTQSSLNSFHSAGTLKMNLTGGMSRMNELMNATENTKTPSLTIYLKKQYAYLSLTDIRKIAFTTFIHVRLDDLLVAIKIEEKPTCEPYYTFFEKMYHANHKPCSHRLRLQINVEKLWLHKITLVQIVQAIDKAIDCTDRLHIVWSADCMGWIDIWLDETIIAEFGQLVDLAECPKISSVLTSQVKVKFYINKCILPSLIPISLSGIEGLKDCYYTEEKQTWRIDTKGGSLKKLLQLPCVDPTRCKSNDMHEIYELFGIEAVKQFLREEYATLIKVNARHLELLIDSMTVSGDIQRVTRNGIDRKQVGAIAKVSFEQPLENFLISASYAETDPLRSVSGCITFGKPAKIGTNYMKMIPFDEYEDKKKIPMWDIPQQEYSKEDFLDEVYECNEEEEGDYEDNFEEEEEDKERKAIEDTFYE